MRLLQRPAITVASVWAVAAMGTLPASAAAQGPTPKREALVGSWVRVLDTREKWRGADEWRGHAIVQHLELQTDGTYRTKSELDGRADSTQFVYWPGAQGREGTWTVRGDTLRFGHDGRYTKYQIVKGDQDLTIIITYHAQNAQDESYHTRCKQVFTRADTTKPLPPPTPAIACDTIAGPFPRPPLPKVVDLLGTWAAVDSSQWQGKPLCTANEACTVVTYDTLTLKADSTLLHTAMQVSPAYPNGKRDETIFRKMRWWVAADTLWRNLEDRAYAWKQPRSTDVSWEDGGRYLLFEGRAYQRASSAAP